MYSANLTIKYVPEGETTGEPLVGATVTLTDDTDSTKTYTGESITDLNGQCVVKVPNGTYLVSAELGNDSYSISGANSTITIEGADSTNTRTLTKD